MKFKPKISQLILFTGFQIALPIILLELIFNLSAIIMMFNPVFLFILLSVFCLLFYLFIAYTNCSITLRDERMTINSFFPFRQKTTYCLSEIDEIVMRHDWSDSDYLKHVGVIRKIWLRSVLPLFQPSGFKWIDINVKGCTKRYYCFGLEYDEFDNPLPHFEDVFTTLDELNVNVVWDSELHEH